jgi:hypothetical protein
MLAEKKRKALMAKYYAEKNKSESEEWFTLLHIIYLHLC